MKFEIVPNENEVINHLSRYYKFDDKIVFDLLRGVCNEYIYSKQNKDYHFYFLEHFYNSLQSLKIQENMIILSSQKIDEYIFIQLLKMNSLSDNIFLIVTKEVGQLYIENFNAEMRYKKYCEGKNYG